MESLNALFEYATEGIIISGKDGKIIRANPSAEKLFGYDSGELVYRTIEDLVPKRFADSHHHHRHGFNEKPHPRSMGKNMELFAKRKDDTEFPVEISLSYYKQQEELFVIAFIVDVTERKLAKDKIEKTIIDLEKKFEERTKDLKKTLLELELSKDELSKALENQKELNDMKSRFVSMASHEFRTPLSTILSSVSLINKYKNTEEEEKRRKHVERIKSSVSNMTMILNDFLSAGRLEEGKISNNPSNINIPNFIREVIQEINGLKKAGQEINYQHIGYEETYIDIQILRNIIFNLLSNAIKFSGEDKPITIASSVMPKQLIFSVADRGIGISEEEKSNLFQRFFRAKNATNIQGTGLGLHIVAKYLEALNGEISFESKLNVGTTFYITIPI